MAEEMVVQELIDNAPDSIETERFVEVKIRLHMYGKEKQAWQKVLRLMRHIQNTFDQRAEFFAGPLRLTDNGSKQP